MSTIKIDLLYLDNEEERKKFPKERVADVQNISLAVRKLSALSLSSQIHLPIMEPESNGMRRQCSKYLFAHPVI